jgi:hypothetical protein
MRRLPRCASESHRPGGQLARLIDEVSGEAGNAGVRRAIDIALEDGRQGGRVAGVEGGIEGGDETVEDIAHRLDLLGHTQVADAQFADRPVHVPEEQLDQRLREVARRGLALETPQQQRQMQRHHVEAAGHGVGDAPLGVEARLSGLRHNGPVRLVYCVRGDDGLAEQIEDHGRRAPQRFLPRQTATLASSRSSSLNKRRSVGSPGLIRDAT